MEEEQKPEEATEAPAEEKTEEVVPEEKKEEAPVEEAPAEEAAAEETKAAEDVIRDIINFINVKKEEEVEGATHRIEADTAAQLVEKLEELAKKIGEIA